MFFFEVELLSIATNYRQDYSNSSFLLFTGNLDTTSSAGLKSSLMVLKWHTVIINLQKFIHIEDNKFCENYLNCRFFNGNDHIFSVTLLQITPTYYLNPHPWRYLNINAHLHQSLVQACISILQINLYTQFPFRKQQMSSRKNLTPN